MKYISIVNRILTALVFLIAFLYETLIFSQENSKHPVCLTRNILSNPVSLNKINKGFLLFKSIGIKAGYVFNEYGWHHPFPLITQNYKNPKIAAGYIGVYIEGLSTRYYSTIIDIAYRSRKVKFNYNLYDGSGNVIGTNTADNLFNITMFSISEKLKYTLHAGTHELVFYCFGGLKYDIINSTGLDAQLQSLLKDYKSSTVGFTSGIGFSIGKKFRFSTDIYFSSDFDNIYKTDSGNYKNTEIGFVLGFGYLNL